MIRALIFLILLSSCSLFQKKGDWGKKAFSSFQGHHVARAFVKNVKSAHVWVPGGTALLIHWGGYDQKISNWAYEEKNIYGDQTAADNWSDNFDEVLKYEMFVTPLFTSSASEDESSKEWLWRKARGYGVIAVSSRVPDYVHDRLAATVQRERPNHADERSFPSGHSTQAGTRNIITLRNLEAIPMNPDLRFGIETSNTVMAGGILWARIEGKRHYPSDVLAGYALCALLSGFLYDWLMYDDRDENENIALLPARDNWTLMYTYAF
jgi:hypothetical protein